MPDLLDGHRAGGRGGASRVSAHFLQVSASLKYALQQQCHRAASSRACLAGTIEHSAESEVKCPHTDVAYSCDMAILDREITAVSPGWFRKES